MDNMEIYNKARAVPESAKEKITGGRLKGKTSINAQWRIEMLTELFGPCGFGWHYEVIEKRMEEYEKQIAVFVDIALYVKNGNDWSKPIFGTGGNMFVTKEKTGMYVSDECFKMALTDALSVACKQLGIGADIYWDLDETKYPTGQDPNSPPKQSSTSQQILNRIKPVINELQRTGYSAAAVLNKYNVASLEQMSDLQIKDFLQKMANVPDKKE